MGYAVITSGGTDGRYTIEIDYGAAAKASLVAAYGQLITTLDSRILAQQVVVADYDALEAALAASIQTSIDGIIGAGDDPTAVGAAQLVFENYLKQLRAMQALSLPARLALSSLKAQRTSARLKLKSVNEIVGSETRNAWCCDFTENGSGGVATVDIPGEPELILIAPGAPGWTPPDGYFRARGLMSPEQAYFNAAILPGWQKFEPTYRWGQLTRIDWDANTGNVTLASATSSADNLNVNQSSSLDNVPFSYMNSDARAFNDDSRVVVDLRDGWASPQIIGFLDNPRPDVPTLVNNVTEFSMCAGRSYFFDMRPYFAGGAEPRSFRVASGTLPPGLSLSDEGLISGKPIGDHDSDVVIRCADAFYDDAKNRRYADTNSFHVEVFDDYTIDRLVGVGHGEALDLCEDNGEAIAFLSMDHPLTAGTKRARITMQNGLLGDTYTNSADSGIWMQNPNGTACALGPYWHRLSWGSSGYRTDIFDVPNFIGPDESVRNVWVAGLPSPIEWRLKGFNTIGPIVYTENVTIELDIATDANGDDIVCSIGGSFRLQLAIA